MLGSLPTYTTGTGFIITPVVALVEPGFALQPNPYEVADAFEVPLAFLMNPAHHRRHAIEIERHRREWFSCRGRDGDRRQRGATSSGARPRRCCAISTASWPPEAPARRVRRPAGCKRPHAYHHPRMSFFAILFALLIEQVRPLARRNPIHARCAAGRAGPAAISTPAAHSHAWVAWCMAVLAPALGVDWGVCIALPASAGCSACCGRRGAVRDARLSPVQPPFHRHPRRARRRRRGEARALLAQWRKVDASELPRSEIVRHVIEYSVLAAHRHVFGVLAWFACCSRFGLGPAGAVLYRMAEFVARYWAQERRPAAIARQRAPDAACRSACCTRSTRCRRGSRPRASRWSAASRKPSNGWRRDASLWKTTTTA